MSSEGETESLQLLPTKIGEKRLVGGDILLLVKLSEVILNDLGLLLPIEVAEPLPLLITSLQIGGAAILVAVAVGGDKVVYSFTQVARADMMVLVHVGQLVDQEG